MARPACSPPSSSRRRPKPGQDFFPLTVHYQEKTYAAGKIPGGFFKREARPSEKEVLTSRLIDRPIRPLFVEGFKNEVQVIVTVLSYDMENDPDIVGMIAASAALTLSGVPFMGPIGAARVGFVDGAYVLNPAVDDMEKLRDNPEQRLDLIVAGTKDAVMMVESEAYELSEAEMLGAVKFGHEQMQPVIDLIIDMAEDAAKEPFAFDARRHLGALRAGEGRRRRGDARRLRHPQQARAPRRRRRRQGGDPRRPLRGGAGRPEPRLGDQEARVRRRALATSSTTAAASTAATSSPSARSSPRSACCRAPTARRSSPAARPRRWW